jgi:hypothetical protein
MRGALALAGLAVAASLLIAVPPPARSTESPASPPAGPALERPGGATTAPAGAAVLDLQLKKGTHDRAIPWDALDRESYLRVRDVVADSFAAREVRDIVFRSRPEVLEFLLDHPDFASQVGVALRRGKYRLRRAGDAYDAEDGQGARGRMWQLLHDGGRRVFYIEGHYDGLMLPTFSGRLVVLLDTAHLEGLDGMTYCEARFAGFVKFDSGLAEIVVRAVRALSEAQVDRGVRRFFRHVAALSRRAYDDPEGLADELDGRPGLSPEMLARFRTVLTAHLPPRWAKTEVFRLAESEPLDVGLGPLIGDAPGEPPAPLPPDEPIHR